MTGPEHYGHAEALLDMASDDEIGSDMERYHVAKAQVHATLALAAATAVGCSTEDGPPARDWDAWREAACTKAVNTAATAGGE
jgi:hypothetical protein